LVSIMNEDANSVLIWVAIAQQPEILLIPLTQQKSAIRHRAYRNRVGMSLVP